jgi:hypothetical protein
MDDGMMRAYRAAKRIVEDELPKVDRNLLAGVRDTDLVVVTGSYDRVEDVLRLAGLPHKTVHPSQLGQLHLEAHQVLIVNCPGHVGQNGLATIHAFLERGGTLVTTDWALKHVLEPMFPGVVAYNGRRTGDEVVRIELKDPSNPFLKGMFHKGADPLWWLEGSSYPIRILDTARVEVLIASKELQGRHGDAPVAIKFACGAGEVLHMISHYYLQRAELRTDRHKASWKEYAAEIGRDALAANAPAELNDLKVGEVEAAHWSLKFMTNVVISKQRKDRGGEG